MWSSITNFSHNWKIRTSWFELSAESSMLLSCKWNNTYNPFEADLPHAEKLGCSFAPAETENSSWRMTFQVTMRVILLKVFFFLRCFSQIFAIANQSPAFSISRLPNMENFWSVNINLGINNFVLNKFMHVTWNLVFIVSAMFSQNQFILFSCFDSIKQSIVTVKTL